MRRSKATKVESDGRRVLIGGRVVVTARGCGPVVGLAAQTGDLHSRAAARRVRKCRARREKRSEEQNGGTTKFHVVFDDLKII